MIFKNEFHYILKTINFILLIIENTGLGEGVAEFVNIVVAIFTFNLFMRKHSLYKEALLPLSDLMIHILAGPNF